MPLSPTIHHQSILSLTGLPKPQEFDKAHFFPSRDLCVVSCAFVWLGILFSHISSRHEYFLFHNKGCQFQSSISTGESFQQPQYFIMSSNYTHLPQHTSQVRGFVKVIFRCQQMNGRLLWRIDPYFFQQYHKSHCLYFCYANTLVVCTFQPDQNDKGTLLTVTLLLTIPNGHNLTHTTQQQLVWISSQLFVPQFFQNNDQLMMRVENQMALQPDRDGHRWLQNSFRKFDTYQRNVQHLKCILQR